MIEYFGTNLSEHGHYTWSIQNRIMNKTWLNFQSLPFNPEELTNNLIKGSVIFYQGGGFTLIGISGSCKDTRPGTKSIFWVKEIISRDQMIGRIKEDEICIKLIEAMPFEINWQIKNF